MTKIYHFEKLDVWQQSRQVVVAVYNLVKKFPVDERFGLCDQMRRAAISVPSNIAEGVKSEKLTLVLDIFADNTCFGNSAAFNQLCQANELTELTLEVKPVAF